MIMVFSGVENVCRQNHKTKMDNGSSTMSERLYICHLKLDFFHKLD